MTTPSEPSPANTLLQRPFYRQIDFWLGFIGWYVVNGLLWMTMGRNAYGYTMSCGLVLLPVNLLVGLVAFVFKRRRLAGGFVAAMGVNFIIAMILGAFTNAVCAIPFFVR